MKELLTTSHAHSSGAVPPAPMGDAYPAACVHELFEVRVAEAPERTAIMYGEERVPYGVLNARANRVAHALRRKGVGREVPVGIAIADPISAATAVLGILKAGGAYVALNRSDPPRRVREVIEQSGLRIVLGGAGQPARLPEDVDVLSIEDRAVTTESETNPTPGVTPDNLAFIRFTSGSTGTPKGVANIHRGITSRLATSHLPDIEAADVCAVNTALGFGTRLFYPLVMGARVALVPDADWKDVSRLSKLVDSLEITCIYAVPSLLRRFVDSGPSVARSLQKLRVVTAGGETLPPDVAVRFRELFPDTRLINSYGSNEIGTMAAMRVIDDGAQADSRSIGNPVVNTTIYILDPDMQPVPAGSSGEIHVGARHLARGYAGNPALTAERFVPDPFSARPGARLYRTGDLGRVAADGSIEFLGREDDQVKIRGFRIELDEIRMALEADEDVGEAAVRAWDMPNAPSLAAYVVARSGADVSPSRLRRHLEARLPEHMIPASFVELPALPRTFNGKVAVGQLPPPSGVRPDIETEYAAAGTDTERVIVEIWEESLDVRPVGIHDNFIELGGDSLLAVEAAAQISETFSAEIPIEVMFDQTVAQIARRIQTTDSPGEER